MTDVCAKHGHGLPCSDCYFDAQVAAGVIDLGAPARRAAHAPMPHQSGLTVLRLMELLESLPAKAEVRMLAHFADEDANGSPVTGALYDGQTVLLTDEEVGD